MQQISATRVLLSFVVVVVMLKEHVTLGISDTKATRPSAGCKYGTPPAPANLTERQLFVHGPGGLKANRTFVYTLPSSYFAAPVGTPAPLLLFFHGQGCSYKDALVYGFEALAARDRVVTVYPAGMSEGAGYESGWNCGTGGDNTTCISSTSGVCYPSCRTLHQCSPCDWATCYDDISFVSSILDILEQELCIDLGRLYAAGDSNGAMFVHHLVQQMPERFSAAAPLFGHPLLGYLMGGSFELMADAGGKRTGPALLQLHGRSDPTIPPQGGVTAQGWLYESLLRSLGTWAAVQGCSTAAPHKYTSPWEGGPQHIACQEYPSCPKRVAWCMYDGKHGSLYWPGANASAIVWNFLQDAPPAPAPAPSFESVANALLV